MQAKKRSRPGIIPKSLMTRRGLASVIDFRSYYSLILPLILLGNVTWMGLWLTPDQQGQRYMDRGEFEQAANSFRDPTRQGVAWFRAGEFEKAEQAFARVASADAEFNRGNCLIMMGKYDQAVERFDRSLELRPDWEDAIINREIAVARAERTKQEGGEMGDQKIGADEIKFDKKKSGGEETETEAKAPLSSKEMQAMWLRRVQTKPADFLKAKFSYQLTFADQPTPEETAESE
jgi:Ca-activated chloride channel family protein